ncbi:MAG: four helix bundle protein [Candidatus Levybacteria bacterium]|nr:four helix bundle protein [Candidatus Levybacteria bacterium]
MRETKFDKDVFKRRLYNFILQLIEFIDKLPKSRVSFVIGDQLLRSGTSILGNYIEGQSASSKKEFLTFIQYCLKSSNESKVWVAVLRDSGRSSKEKADWFLKELNEYSSIFASSVLTIKGKKSI